MVWRAWGDDGTLGARMSSSIAKASLIWGASILLSRVVGLVREGVLGRMLGASSEADVYWAAFVLPDFLNYLLAGGALSIVFIPLFAAHLERGQEREAWSSFSAIAGFLTVALGVLTIFAWVGMPQLVPLVAPGFDEAQLARLVDITRIILPAQLFHVIGGLIAASLQARDRHGAAALAPVVYNVAIIAGGLIGGRAHGAEGFAWGVLAGSALGPFLTTWIAARGIGLSWSFGLDLGHPDLRAYLARSLPIMLGFSIVVVDDWFLRRLGSTIGEGAVSTLSYAKNLMKVPLGVFGLAAGVAAYPTLARLGARGELGELRLTLLRTLRPLLLLCCAATAVLLVAATPLVTAIYGREALTPEQLRSIVMALNWMALGLTAWSVHNVLARGFYALGNTWMPALLGTGIAALAYPLYALAAGGGRTSSLALVSTFAILAYVAVLGWQLKKRLPGWSSGELHDLKVFIARLAVATATGWALGMVFSLALPEPRSLTGAIVQTSLLAGLTVGGLLIAGDRLHLAEVRQVLQPLLSRLKRTPSEQTPT